MLGSRRRTQALRTATGNGVVAVETYLADPGRARATGRSRTCSTLMLPPIRLPILSRGQARPTAEICISFPTKPLGHQGFAR